MCASCGCGMANEDHGDDRHITRNDLEQAAEAANISGQEVVENLQETVRQEGMEGKEQQAGARAS